MSNKDSYWFRHDASAGRGLKMRKMAHIYSHWGKGIYWDVVEILRDQKNYQFENDESSLALLCDLVGCKDTSRFMNWFNDSLRIGLFENNGDYFICPPLCANMVRWEASKNNGSKGGRPTKKPKLKPKNNLNDNLDETIIEEESIEEDKIKEKIIINNSNFLNESLESSQWSETVAMQFTTTIDVVKLYLSNFNDHLITMEEQKKTTKDFKSHFVHWLKKQDLSQHRRKVIGRTNQI